MGRNRWHLGPEGENHRLPVGSGMMEPAAAADQGAMISQLGGRRSRRVALNHSEFIIGGDGGDGGNGNSFLIMSRRPAQGGAGWGGRRCRGYW